MEVQPEVYIKIKSVRTLKARKRTLIRIKRYEEGKKQI